jgi:hypothetical protein
MQQQQHGMYVEIKNSKLEVHPLQTIFRFMCNDCIHSQVCGSKLYLQSARIISDHHHLTASYPDIWANSF